MTKNINKQFLKLVNLMEKLRGPRGCLWDRKQSHKSLVKYLFEEAREVKHAVGKNDWKNLEEELGDILLQVLFHSQIAKENGLFDIYDVLRILTNKLIRRHPHVFGKKKLKTSKAITKQWIKIKRLEKAQKK
ncbi:MazG nucleotide pyrophosphohydrolase domain-containing protein [Elusimicrobiota bacterium]